MATMNPEYLETLLAPQPNSERQRRVWSIGLNTVWVPYLTAMKLKGKLPEMPLDAIGYPLRLSYSKDGSVRFSKKGEPVFQVARPITAQIRDFRLNMEASLLEAARSVRESDPEGYADLVASAREHGQPIQTRDIDNITLAVAQVKSEMNGAAVKEPAPSTA